MIAGRLRGAHPRLSTGAGAGSRPARCLGFLLVVLLALGLARAAGAAEVSVGGHFEASGTADRYVAVLTDVFGTIETAPIDSEGNFVFRALPANLPVSVRIHDGERGIYLSPPPDRRWRTAEAGLRLGGFSESPVADLPDGPGCFRLGLRFLGGEALLDESRLQALSADLSAMAARCVVVLQIVDAVPAGLDLVLVEYDPAWLPVQRELLELGVAGSLDPAALAFLPSDFEAEVGYFALLPEAPAGTPRAPSLASVMEARLRRAAPDGAFWGFLLACFVQGERCAAVSSARPGPGSAGLPGQQAIVRDLAFQLAPHLIELSEPRDRPLPEEIARATLERLPPLTVETLGDRVAHAEALEALRRLPNSALQQAYLEPLKAGLREDLRALAEDLESAGVALPPWGALPEGEGETALFFRYDVHNHDIVQGLALAGLHEELGLPAAFFLTTDHGIAELLYQPFYRLFGRYRSGTVELGLHASPLSSFFIFRAFGALEAPRLLSNKEVFGDRPWAPLFSLAGEEIRPGAAAAVEEILEGAEQRQRRSLDTFRRLFGESRVVSSHGVRLVYDFDETMGRDEEGRGRPLDPAAAEMRKLLIATDFLAYLRDERGLGPWEATLECLEREDLECGFEGIGGRAMVAELARLLGREQTVLQLMHPASLWNGRVDLSLWTPGGLGPSGDADGRSR